MSQKIVRWGIMSTARIAETAFIPAVRQTKRGEIVAIASRSQAKAETFAKKHNIPQVFGDYTSMLASDAIDAVYNPLPNTMHAEWTAVAANYGKHIFCEKPLAVTSAEARQMVDTCQASGVLLTEAFVFLSHPQTLKLRSLLNEGVIGNLIQLYARQTFVVPRPSNNIRLNKELGGGSLLDVGCYPITFARFVFAAEPIAVQATIRIDSDDQVDTRAILLLTFSDNRQAALQAGFDTMGGQEAVLCGDKGYIQIPVPYHPGEKSHFVVHTADGSETFIFNNDCVPFMPAVEQFHDCVLDGAALQVPPDNAIGTMQIIEAALQSARTGERVALHGRKDYEF